jgi:hypothetical protein
MTTQQKTAIACFSTRAIVAGALTCALAAACGGGAPVSGPKDLAVSNGVLTWTDSSSNQAEYRIERRPAGGYFQQLGVVPAGTTQYRDETERQAGTTYSYRILVTTSSAPWAGTYSNQVSDTAS